MEFYMWKRKVLVEPSVQEIYVFVCMYIKKYMYTFFEYVKYIYCFLMYWLMYKKEK